MNFFGHAAVAMRQSDSPAFLLGAMLPDLSAMAGLRPPDACQPELSRGIALHHATDAAFHRLAGFRRLCSWALDELGAAGLSRGSARAVGHVGSELLLDGVLCADRHALSGYRRAIAHAGALLGGGALRFHAAGDRQRLQQGLARLAGAPLPEGYTDPAFVADRLTRVLARRPRLALRDGDATPVERWLRRARPAVERDLSAAVEELAAALPRTTPSR